MDETEERSSKKCTPAVLKNWIQVVTTRVEFNNITVVYVRYGLMRHAARVKNQEPITTFIKWFI